MGSSTMYLNPITRHSWPTKNRLDNTNI